MRQGVTQKLQLKEGIFLFSIFGFEIDELYFWFVYSSRSDRLCKDTQNGKGNLKAMKFGCDLGSV
jgi:hypothetical protein